MELVIHPGPIRQSRQDLAACEGMETEVVLAAGVSLDVAVNQALEKLGRDSAYIDIRAAKAAPLNFVGPIYHPEGNKAAWYSETRVFEHGFIEQLGIIVGKFEESIFLHGHGVWSADECKQTLGHVLPSETHLAEPTTVRVVALSGVRFDRRKDEETGFDVFHVDSMDEGNSSFAALKLFPNQDITQALSAARKSLGWEAARAFGIGSLNGAVFANGNRLYPQPTEFLITNAKLSELEDYINVSIVGVDGKQFHAGRLKPNKNPILITTEIVLKKV